MQTDGPTSLSFEQLAAGTRISTDGRLRATADRAGNALVALLAGAHTIVLRAPLHRPPRRRRLDPGTLERTVASDST